MDLLRQDFWNYGGIHLQVWMPVAAVMILIAIWIACH
jgi:hypothetical protein